MHWFPGWPGPLTAGARLVGSIPLPALPVHPGGGVAAATSPLAGLAAYGVPVAHTRAGQPVLQSGLGQGGLPPVIPGMPAMPMPSPAEGGGLFQPAQPVVPFDHGNQVRRLHADCVAQTPPVEVCSDIPADSRNPWEHWCQPRLQA